MLAVRIIDWNKAPLIQGIPFIYVVNCGDLWKLGTLFFLHLNACKTIDILNLNWGNTVLPACKLATGGKGSVKTLLITMFWTINWRLWEHLLYLIFRPFWTRRHNSTESLILEAIQAHPEQGNLNLNKVHKALKFVLFFSCFSSTTTMFLDLRRYHLCCRFYTIFLPLHSRISETKGRG